MRAVILLPVLAVVLPACGHPGGPRKPPAAPPASMPVPERREPSGSVWRVVSVRDGDTLTAIDAGLAQHRVRLQGIDAPELGQPFGRVARDRLAALAKGQPTTVRGSDRDRYGRLIAAVEVEGDDLGQRLVAEGLAWHYTRYSDDEGLAAAEREARAARRGLWADAKPVPPWEWRAGERDRKAAKRQPAGR